jgi:hypothetical protein
VPLEAHVRALRLAVLPLLIAGSLAAQAPPPATDASSPVAVVSPARGGFLDLVALAGGRARLGVEPLRLGSWTVDLVAGRSRSSAIMMDTHQLIPPAVPGPVGSRISDGWSLDVAVRFYPAPLAAGAPRRGLAPYVGVFVGYQSRTVRIESDYVGYDPTTGLPLPPPTERLTGFEPGAEIGLRLMPLRPLFVDVGGWFELVRIDDPTRSVRPGQIDARLVAAVGVGW